VSTQQKKIKKKRNKCLTADNVKIFIAELGSSSKSYDHHLVHRIDLVERIEVVVERIEVVVEQIGVVVEQIEVVVEQIGVVVEQIEVVEIVEVVVDKVAVVVQQIEVVVQQIEVVVQKIEVVVQKIEVENIEVVVEGQGRELDMVGGMEQEQDMVVVRVQAVVRVLVAIVGKAVTMVHLLILIDVRDR